MRTVLITWTIQNRRWEAWMHGAIEGAIAGHYHILFLNIHHANRVRAPEHRKHTRPYSFHPENCFISIRSEVCICVACRSSAVFHLQRRFTVAIELIELKCAHGVGNCDDRVSYTYYVALQIRSHSKRLAAWLHARSGWGHLSRYQKETRAYAL